MGTPHFTPLSGFRRYPEDDAQVPEITKKPLMDIISYL